MTKINESYHQTYNGKVKHNPIKGYKIFHLDRVSYGRKDTSIEKREYKVREFQSSAVGPVNEIADFYKR